MLDGNQVRDQNRSRGWQSIAEAQGRERSTRAAKIRSEPVRYIRGV